MQSISRFTAEEEMKSKSGVAVFTFAAFKAFLIQRGTRFGGSRNADDQFSSQRLTLTFSRMDSKEVRSMWVRYVIFCPESWNNIYEINKSGE